MHIMLPQRMCIEGKGSCTKCSGQAATQAFRGQRRKVASVVSQFNRWCAAICCLHKCTVHAGGAALCCLHAGGAALCCLHAGGVLHYVAYTNAQCMQGVCCIMLPHAGGVLQYVAYTNAQCMQGVLHYV